MSYTRFLYHIVFRAKNGMNTIPEPKEHYKKVNFEAEYRQFLIENDIDIDERYFLKVLLCPALQAVGVLDSMSLGR